MKETSRLCVSSRRCDAANAVPRPLTHALRHAVCVAIVVAQRQIERCRLLSGIDARNALEVVGLLAGVWHASLPVMLTGQGPAQIDGSRMFLTRPYWV